MDSAISNDEILATLRELSAGIAAPLWLFGGVAVDFLVGRWTRPHGDIDLNALASDRARLTGELHQLGYRTPDQGWLTQWFHQIDGRRLEIVFLEQTTAGGLELVIRANDPIGIPGRYPMIKDYLVVDRFATLGNVTFRVSSPAGEWLARAAGLDVVDNRAPQPKLEHDKRLLEQLLSPTELARLRLSLPTSRPTRLL
jgi:hypothetical protein